MFNFLHTFLPSPIFFSFGSFNVYWYGFFVFLGTIAGLIVSLKIAKKFGLSSEKVFDLAFWLILCGIIGARLYHIFLEFDYYSHNFLNIFKVWEGGLAIHGGIIGALLAIIFYSRQQKINFWILAGVFAPALSLGQAIGRWGNYFNQELFGKPTELPWGIPIDLINRPHLYISSDFFHPTFIYEFFADLLIFFILLFLIKKLVANKEEKNTSAKIVLLSYLIMYSILRFSLEFLRTDTTAYFLNWRWPQIASLIIFTVAVLLLILPKIKKRGIK